MKRQASLRLTGETEAKPKKEPKAPGLSAKAKAAAAKAHTHNDRGAKVGKPHSHLHPYII